MVIYSTNQLFPLSWSYKGQLKVKQKLNLHMPSISRLNFRYFQDYEHFWFCTVWRYFLKKCEFYSIWSCNTIYLIMNGGSRVSPGLQDCESYTLNDETRLGIVIIIINWLCCKCSPHIYVNVFCNVNSD